HIDTLDYPCRRAYPHAYDCQRRHCAVPSHRYLHYHFSPPRWEKSPSSAAIIWQGIGFEYSAGHIVGEPRFMRSPQRHDGDRLGIAQNEFAPARRADPGRLDAEGLGLFPERQDLVALRVEIERNEVAALVFCEILQDGIMAFEVDNARAQPAGNRHFSQANA